MRPLSQGPLYTCDSHPGGLKTGALWPSMSAFLIPITEGEAPGIFTGGEVTQQDKKGFIITGLWVPVPPVPLTAAWPEPSVCRA